MNHSRRFALFRVLTIFEVVLALGCIIWIFQGAQGVFVLALLMTMAYAYVAGFVIAVLGVIAKPRQRLMLVSLAVHILIGLVILIMPGIGKWMDKRQQEEYRQMRELYPPQ